MTTIIKRRVEYYYISGHAMKQQRMAAGLSLNELCKLIRLAIGTDYIDINGATRQISKQTVFRMEKMTELGLTPETAEAIVKIFES